MVDDPTVPLGQILLRWTAHPGRLGGLGRAKAGGIGMPRNDDVFPVNHDGSLAAVDHAGASFCHRKNRDVVLT